MCRTTDTEPSAGLAVEPRARGRNPRPLLPILHTPDKSVRSDYVDDAVDGYICNQGRENGNGCLGLAGHLLKRIRIDCQGGRPWWLIDLQLRS